MILWLCVILCVTSCTATQISSCKWQNKVYYLHDSTNNTNTSCAAGSHPLVIDSIMEASVISLFKDIKVMLTRKNSKFYWSDGSSVSPTLFKGNFGVNSKSGIGGCATFKGGALVPGCAPNRFICEAIHNANISVDKECVVVPDEVPCDHVLAGHCYNGIKKRLTWIEAQGQCMKQGGYIATITTGDEQTFVHSVRKQEFNREGVWIGLTSGFSSNHFDFKWVATKEKREFGRTIKKYPWSSREPENRRFPGSVKENCVVLGSGQRWADYRCDTVGAINVICEIENDPRTRENLESNAPVVVVNSNLYVPGNISINVGSVLQIKKDTAVVDVSECFTGSFTIDSKNIESTTALIAQRKNCEEISPEVNKDYTQCVRKSRKNLRTSSILRLQITKCREPINNGNILKITFESIITMIVVLWCTL